jgi:O-antigen/teichoic acid export membrane protein
MTIEQNGGRSDAKQSGVMTADGRQFSRRAVATFGTNVIVAGLSLVSVLITSRVLGPAGRGDIAFLTTTAFLAAQVMALGLGPATMVIAGRDPARSGSIASTALLVAVALGVAAFGLVVVVLAAVSPEASEAVPLWLEGLLGGAIPLLIAQVALQQLAQAHYRFAVTNAAWLLPPAVNVAVNLSLAAVGRLTVTSAVMAWIGGQAIATALLLVVMWRQVGLGRPSLGLARELVGFGARSHLARVLLIGNYRVDQWILGAVAGSSALGTYSVAVAWSESLFFLPTALASVQRPDLVRLAAVPAGRLAARVFRVAMVSSAPLAVVLIVAAPFLTAGVFGPGFEESALQLRILVLGAFGVTALKIVGNALTAQRRPLLESAAVAVSFVLIVVLDVVLIPSHGAVGAAVASSVAYTAGGLAAAVIFTRVLAVPLTHLVPRLGDVRGVASLTSLGQRRDTAP